MQMHPTATRKTSRGNLCVSLYVPILFEHTLELYGTTATLQPRQSRLLPFPSPPPAYAALVVVTTPSASALRTWRHQQEQPPTPPSPAAEAAAAAQQQQHHRSSCQPSALRTVQTKRSEVAGCARASPPASRPPSRSSVAGTAEYSSDVRRNHSRCQAPSWAHSTAPTRPLQAVRRARSGHPQQPRPFSVLVPEGSRASNGPEHRIGSSGLQHRCRRPRRCRPAPRHHLVLR